MITVQSLIATSWCVKDIEFRCVETDEVLKEVMIWGMDTQMIYDEFKEVGGLLVADFIPQNEKLVIRLDYPQYSHHKEYFKVTEL